MIKQVEGDLITVNHYNSCPYKHENVKKKHKSNYDEEVLRNQVLFLLALLNCQFLIQSR